MAKRGRPFKHSEKCSVGDVRQAIADLDFEREATDARYGKPGESKNFLAGEPGSSRSAKQAKLMQIRDMRKRGYAVLKWPKWPHK
jgi:hypothetical protein